MTKSSGNRVKSVSFGLITESLHQSNRQDRHTTTTNHEAKILARYTPSKLICSHFGDGIMYVYVAVWSFVMTHCYKRLPLLEKLSKAESKSNPLDLV